MIRWMRISLVCCVPVVLAASACADDRGGGGTGNGNDAEGDGDGDGDGDATAEGDGDGDATATAEGDGDGDGDSNGETKWDVLAYPDAPPCTGGDGDTDHSYIWIANSSQGSVSKINTQTMIEEGRYRVRADSAGNPSRTSVALTGNVAVANRSGGVVKLFANTDECQESNGMPGIQTSTGGNDLLAWEVEECRAWYTPFNYTTQRPLAWAQGVWNNQTCTYSDEKLWTAGNVGNAEVVLMDGDTGAVEDMVVIPNVIGWAGLYGGAVDGDGNFWTVDHNWSGPSTLIRVMRDDLTFEEWEVTGQVHYGLAVDSKGRAWLCGSGGASRFDPQNEMWTHLAPANGGSALGGCMEDAEGRLWNSRYPDAVLVAIDTDTVQIVKTINIPAYTHGISIDFEGHVWGVQFGGTDAYRVDPETDQIDTFTGLSGAYTYSDMTGFALSSAGVPNG